MNTPINVVILAYPNLCLFEFGCALEVFAQRRPEFPKPHYNVKIFPVDTPSSSASVEVGFGGLSVSAKAENVARSLALADLVLIPGWQGMDIEPTAELVSQLVQAHQRGATLASICSGVFLLAHAGLLNKRRATTHWRYIEAARARFPLVDFDEAVLFVQSDRLITSAGSAAGLDMCLHLVRQHYGQHIANSYARRLVVPPIRDGGQAQYIQQSLVSPSNRFNVLVEAVQNDTAQHYSVKRMAELVNLSERHFLRKFKQTFNATPAKWLARLRLQKACDLLETTDWPIKKVAHEAGLGSEENLRHHFRNTLQTSPAEYRSTFGH